MSGISFKNVKKVYGNIIAVDNFNLEIADKEFVILVGPSGCGKSTTLRMIAGLEEISEGELKIGDIVVNDIAPKDRDIAMVFQNYALYPHMTVFENMAFCLKLRKISKNIIQEKVNEAAKILDIQHLLTRKPKALSGGQRQRVALGRAMVRNPKVFLLDEPLSNLDAKLRTQMRSEISKLHQKLGTTFVYVTHDQTEAMTMGDRIVVMKDGIIQQVDTPYNLFNYPSNIFVAGFIGSPQMNFLEGTLQKQENNFFVNMGKNKIFLPASKYKNLNDYLNKKVIIGIRPDNINEAENTTDNNVFSAKVDIVEMIGTHINIYFEFEGCKIIGKFSPTANIKVGNNILFKLDEERIHLFDSITEKTITN